MRGGAGDAGDVEQVRKQRLGIQWLIGRTAHTLVATAATFRTTEDAR